MLTNHLHGLPFHSLRLRSDLLDLHNGFDQAPATDTANAVRSLVSHGFNPCHPQPDHWVFCRGSQRVHLYSPDELDRFARRYTTRHHRPDSDAAPVTLPSATKETTA